MNKDDPVVPNRKGLLVTDAWVELEDHVQSLIALIALRRKLPWRTSMVQMLEVAERLVGETQTTNMLLRALAEISSKIRTF